MKIVLIVVTYFKNPSIVLNVDLELTELTTAVLVTKMTFIFAYEFNFEGIIQNSHLKNELMVRKRNLV